MKTITLQRIVEGSLGDGVLLRGMFGVLIDNTNGVPFAVTLEQPWRNNSRFVSCIPADTYTCVEYTSSKFPNTYEVTGVMERSSILLHKGNYVDDTGGCILVAEKFEVFGNEAVIADSRGGFNDLREVVESYKEWRLIIRSPMILPAP